METTTDPVAARADDGGSSVRIALLPAAPPLPRVATVLMTIVLLLVGVGVLMVQSASQVTAIASGGSALGPLVRQAGYALLGLGLLAGFSRIDPETLQRRAWWLLLAGLVLQLLVHTPLGHEAGGNRNWLMLGPLSFQPAEFMKAVFLIWVSTILTRKHRRLDRWADVVVPILPITALSMVINVIAGDMGTLMIVAAVVFGCLFFSEIRTRILAGIAGVAAIGMVVMTIIKPNRVFRLSHFFAVDCVADASEYQGMCWQTVHGLWALAEGGLFGSGLGNSKAKWAWLPESETDFIFAIFGEEAGLVGAILLLTLFGALVGILIILHGRVASPFTRSALGGMATWLGVQTAVNIGVVLGFVPVLGVPLPFISAGGTSLITTCIGIGVVVSCLRHDAARGAVDLS